MTGQKKLKIWSTVIALIYTAEYFISGIFIFKNMYYTFSALPYIISVFALVPSALFVVNDIFLSNNKLSAAIIVSSVLMAIGHFLFTAFVLSKLTFILITCIPLFCVSGIVALFLFMLLAYPKLSKKLKRISVVLLSVIIFIVSVFGIFDFSFFRFTSDGVVFAVEDEYQIAWSTSVKSTGSVTIDGTTYYDVSNGQNRVSVLHKICVPMDVLDAAKSYTISSVPVYSQSAYLSVSGGARSCTYSFRSVDTSDGLQIYNISDNHECISGASKAAKYFGDKLDVLILNGDIINDVSSLWQISLIYKLAGKITGGEVPVIYSRGNHECNGKYAEVLADYVGSRNGKLFYNVNLGGAWFTVLDTNNDMEDTNLLISPEANFETVREEQTEWLKNQTYSAENCTYRFLIAHMGFALTGYTRFPEWTEELVELTDGKYDLCISGHSHVLSYSVAETETKTSYPVIKGSIRSNNRTKGEGVNPSAFTGTAIECVNGNITAMFTNSRGEVRDTISVKTANF